MSPSTEMKIKNTERLQNHLENSIELLKESELFFAKKAIELIDEYIYMMGFYLTKLKQQKNKEERNEDI
jgi:hypothetical protein